MSLALRVSLLSLVFNPGVLWVERLPVLALAGAGLVLPHLLRRAELWWALCAATAVPLVWHWPRSDNHEYLIAYWCLAVALACHASLPERTLARSARLLLGLTFAFAVLWKGVLSPDFLDARFFRTAFLVDPRFETLGVLVGGMSPALYASNEAAIEAGLAGASTPFVEPTRLALLARGATVWTLVLEALLALAFLWPRGRGPGRWGDALLLLFLLTTFPLAPVAGFGWLLVTLGLAQCVPDQRGVLALYLAAFLWILAVHAVPWADLLVPTP